MRRFLSAIVRRRRAIAARRRDAVNRAEAVKELRKTQDSGSIWRTGRGGSHHG